MLTDEITNAKRNVKTDAYTMSIGEIVSMYETREVIIDPEFQRFFRWNTGQKSKFIESLLLGIPIPSIFVFEREDSSWELIDGLQRTSTILEFMGKLLGPDRQLVPPSILDATRYLPSLHNVVWERSHDIPDVPPEDQQELSRSQQLSIKRARIGVEILKRPSDDNTKFDLFQRLNAGGTQANAQELRNCIMLMVNAAYYREVKAAAEYQAFQVVMSLTEEQIERQRHMEFAVRFLVHTFVPYDGILDVEEYIDNGIVRLASQGNGTAASNLIRRTFDLLIAAAGGDALRRVENGRSIGKVGLVGLEGIAVGVAKNIDAIFAQPDPHGFVRDKVRDFWAQPQTANLTSPGLRGTTRLQRTVPFGEVWFHP